MLKTSILVAFAAAVAIMAPALPALAQGADCVIKGNVNTQGERIYHMPGDKYYDETRISASHGERWFCSTEEAEAAGWRRSRV